MIDPDDRPYIRKQMAAQVTKTLRAAGLHIVPQELTDALVDLLLRNQNGFRIRVADMVDNCASRYTDMDTDQIERLARVLRTHYLDSKGAVRLPPEGA